MRKSVQRRLWTCMPCEYFNTHSRSASLFLIGLSASCPILSQHKVNSGVFHLKIPVLTSAAPIHMPWRFAWGTTVYNFLKTSINLRSNKINNNNYTLTAKLLRHEPRPLWVALHASSKTAPPVRKCGVGWNYPLTLSVSSLRSRIKFGFCIRIHFLLPIWLLNHNNFK